VDNEADIEQAIRNSLKEEENKNKNKSEKL
jgi:hypothetical protein